ncbi:MAG TPA: Dyp-type peroxidase [Actinomycetes bacterium]|jgi:Dyp-type peroxidase family|nr:Dyp-type peroxidase [Actinomycetes bacterium]
MTTSHTLTLRRSSTIQGNVLAGFNKPHQAFVFLTFPGREPARRWLAGLAPQVTSTTEVTDFRAERRAAAPGRAPSAVWVNLSLTASGLRILLDLGRNPGLAADLRSYPAFWAGPSGIRPDEQSRPTYALLGDVGGDGPRNWVVGGPNTPAVDALLTVAADDPGDLGDRLGDLREAAGALRVTVAREQHGRKLVDPAGQITSREPFGFADGISQPGVRGFTRATVRDGHAEDAKHPGSRIVAAGEFVLGLEREPEAPADAPDGPPEPPAWMHGGSFQVFRRLAQDVAGWQAHMRELAKRHFPAGPDDVVAAKAVGRWPDGTPLALRPQAPGNDPRNDFGYADDPEGFKTPRFAHIRKTNPRDDAPGAHARRILRRGIPFDDPPERGLLFNAYMASIKRQFEFLQWRWANEPTFPSDKLDQPGPLTRDGADPLISPGAGPCVLRRQGPPPDRLELDLRRFVRTTGAVYAFAPSIPALAWLAEGAPPP